MQNGIESLRFSPEASGILHVNHSSIKKKNSQQCGTSLRTDIERDPWNGTESPEIKSCVHGQLVFQQGCPDHPKGKEESFK